MIYIILLLPLCLYFEFLYYFVTLFLLLDIVTLLKKNTKTLEDNYQLYLRNKNKTKSSLIYVCISFENTLYFSDVIAKMEDKLQNYNDIYNFYNSTENICYCIKNYIYYNKKDFLDDEEYHYKFYIDKKNQKIITYIKHEYIGGAYLLSLFYTILNDNQKEIHEIFPKSSFLNLFLVPKLFFDCKNIPKIDHDLCNLVEDKKEIRRYKNNYILTKIDNVSTKTIIIYNLLCTVHKCLKLQRSIVCYLPIAFQHHKNIKNNIGIMWLVFDPSKESLEDLDKKINKSKYQALATNSLILYKNNDIKKGSEIRRGVDVVITIMLGKENNNFEVSWTFENVSEYPIYAAITSIMRENEIHVTQTLTVCTKRFEINDKNFKFVNFKEYKI
jgi:hypothetical protein